MAGNRVLTNKTVLQFGIENGLGVAPTSGNWKILEPNEVSAYGAVIEKVARRPIGIRRGRRKGSVVNLTSGVEFSEDLTIDGVTNFLEGFMFAEAANTNFEVSGFKMNRAALAVNASGYDLAGATTFTTIAGGGGAGGYGENLVSKSIFENVTTEQAFSLFFAKGYAIAANNGLKAITSAMANGGLEVPVTGLTAEASPPTNASLHMAGVRVFNNGANAIALSVADTPAVGQRTLTQVGTITGFSWILLGFRAGSWIHIGSADANGSPQNAFASNAVYGYARVVSATATVLTIEKLDSKITGGAQAPSSGNVDILHGAFCRDLSVTATGIDTLSLERSYQFEETYPGLSGSANEFEYANGNFASTLTLSLPLNALGGLEWAFVGTTSEAITSMRHGGSPAPANALGPLRTAAFGTASDIVRLNVSANFVSAVADVCFKDLSISIDNGVTPENCLGVLGGSFVNLGPFLVNLEGQMLFSDKKIVQAIRDNLTVSLDAILKNDDGSIIIDVPSATVTDGTREFPIDATVLTNVTLETITDPTLNYDLSISVIYGTPTVRP